MGAIRLDHRANTQEIDKGTDGIVGMVRLQVQEEGEPCPCFEDFVADTDYLARTSRQTLASLVC